MIRKEETFSQKKRVEKEKKRERERERGVFGGIYIKKKLQLYWVTRLTTNY